VNVEIRTEAAQFPEKEYINGIFVAVYFSQASMPSPLCETLLLEVRRGVERNQSVCPN
jgi:hypothetical protein